MPQVRGVGAGLTLGYSNIDSLITIATQDAIEAFTKSEVRTTSCPPRVLMPVSSYTSTH